MRCQCSSNAGGFVMDDSVTNQRALQASSAPSVLSLPALSEHLHKRLTSFLAPLLVTLDAQMDARLVRTVQATVEAILSLRHRNYGLLLSELGGCILSPAHAPAGTKRLSNLLRSSRWSAALLERFVWQQAEARVEALE